ncbi:RNA polymerase sigma factor [Noviherbaspirillum galbum]|uniref:Sigma-70 family RNA polymerase sigma factor n=1 Tax=Noviherbaspirillum galbum TaxID=2709383 RepID=A0A6B3SYD1_9BURK|nr:sigma-70 family RNA polymerase sigma factor [Noviherbaspirillum galbum]NEX64755.1 sigma-70 family RNA polymerase sigma factor [Noviherbaspirillum galbum]
MRAVRTAESDPNEARLVAEVAGRDRRAFESLYRLYFGRLARFLDPKLHHAASVEEVINETMLLVWNKAGSFDGSSKVSTWIFGIAYRRALKALARLDLPVEQEADDEADDNALTPDAALTRSEQRRIVGQAIDALPMEQRTVVHLAYFHDMGYDEIARIMDCPANTVKTRMFHARRRLKRLLAGLESELS